MPGPHRKRACADVAPLALPRRAAKPPASVKGAHACEVTVITPRELIARLLDACAALPAGRADAQADALLTSWGGLASLAHAQADEIAASVSLDGGERAAGALATAFEIGRRAALETSAPAQFASSEDVAAWAMPRLGTLLHEELWVIALDGRSRLRGARCVAKGGLHGLGVRAADPLRTALRLAASAFVVVHNHPSGDATPSIEDIEFTERLGAAAAIVGLPLLDHVVVTHDRFTSVPLPAVPTATLGHPVPSPSLASCRSCSPAELTEVE